MSEERAQYVNLIRNFVNFIYIENQYFYFVKSG